MKKNVFKAVLSCVFASTLFLGIQLDHVNTTSIHHVVEVPDELN